jgi:tetratricopeptide (TPR) repeat protein
MLLTPAEIAGEIARDLAFLETDLLDLPMRQQSLRSVFNHSWRLLSGGEREVMSALSVFRGGFTREAAQVIADASLGDLMGLIQKSMLHRTASDRFELHELLRQYAAEKLGADPAAEVDTRDKHSETYCQALAGWESDLKGPRQGAAMAEMAVEIDNIRIAWEWAVDKTKLKHLRGAINGLCNFYYRQNRRLEGEKACQLVVEKLAAMGAADQHTASSLEEDRTDQVDKLKLQVRMLSWGGFFNMDLGNTDLSRKLTQQSLSLLETGELASQDTRFEKAIALLTLSLITGTESLGENKQLADESMELFISLDEHWWMGEALRTLAFFEPRLERVAFFEENLAVRKRQGDLGGISIWLYFLSIEAAQQCQFEKAEGLFYETLAIYRELSDQHRIVDMYRMLGSLLVWQGKFIEARSVTREFLAFYNDLGSSHFLAYSNALAGFPDQYLGEYDSARKQAQKGLMLCRGGKHPNDVLGIAHSISILGRVALAEGSYTEAEVFFQESILIYQTLGKKGNSCQELACLGYVAREMNLSPQAQDYFFDTLLGVSKPFDFLPLIHALPGIALLFTDQGEVERAVELYALAATQGIVANSKWFDDIAGDEIASAAAELPAEVAEAAKARGRALDLWDTAKELMEELGELGWSGTGP